MPIEMSTNTGNFAMLKQLEVQVVVHEGKNEEKWQNYWQE